MSIHHEVEYKCSAQRLFDALTISEQFADLTGLAAGINPEPGGEFSFFDGMITGMTIEIEANKRLVQAWRVGNWEPGIYSIVKFELEVIDEEETNLIFDHTGFPAEHREHLETGWHEKYWQPLRTYLEA